MLPFPLAGLRVLELGSGRAGAYTARTLGDMGAEVIKVGPTDPAAGDLDRSKYSCSLDLSEPAGRDLCLRLAAASDIVVESFTSEESTRWGLDYQALKATKDDLIVVSISAEGNDLRTGGAAAGAVIAALFHHRTTGEGQHIEVVEPDVLASLGGERTVASGMTGSASERPDGPHSSMAQHGVYRCAGDEEWVAISCRDDADFEALCKVMGRPEMAQNERFRDVVSRHRNREELDGIVGEWTRRHSASALSFVLAQAGVPVQRLMTPETLLEDEHLRARGLFERVAQPGAGVQETYGIPYDFSRTPAHIRLSAPSPGEHNDYVLRELLGFGEEEVEELRRLGITH